MRVVFFGSGAFGLPTLQKLATAHEIALVVTQPDRPAGRNRKLTPTPIAEFAMSRGMAIIKPENVNEPAVVDQIRSVNAEAFVVIAFGQKLGRRLLEGVFAINLHGSLLPKYRGAAPINWAMINGETTTGVSVITLADRMDAGEILATRSVAIDPMETAGELHDRLALLGPEAVLQVLELHVRGELKPQPQDESQVTYAPKLSKADGTVHFDQPALRVRQRVHGLTPWPGCTVKLAGRPLRLMRVKVAHADQHFPEPGVVQPDLTISCAPGAIQLLAVQPPGGKVMSFAAYCNGQSVPIGARCEPI